MATHPRGLLIAWVVAIALGAWGEHKLPSATIGGTGGIPGSPSDAAGETLRTSFANPFIDPLVVAVSVPHHHIEDGPYLDWLRNTARTLGALPSVRKVVDYARTPQPELRSADGHVTMLLVGLESSDIEAQQRAVVEVRGAVAPLRADLQKLDSAAQVAVTGGPAGDYDVNALSAEGGDYAEKRALPLTLVILMTAFGTLVAASLPFLMGLTTTTVALGAAFVLAKMLPVSNLLSNVVTMIGLAIGIDYSLLMVTYYRELEVSVPRSSTSSPTPWRAPEADHRLVRRHGNDRLFRLAPESHSSRTRCAGIGGALVVCVSVLAALTPCFPAALVLLGPYLERWSVIPRRLRLGNTTNLWRRLGGWIIKRPLRTLIVSGACVMALSLPLLKATTGISNERWFLPHAAESRVGADILATLRSDNASLEIYAVVHATDGQPILAAAHLKPLIDYAQRLARDPRIASVASPVSLQKGFGLAEYTALYQNISEALRGHPEIAELYVSRDRTAALFAITPASTPRGQAGRAALARPRDRVAGRSFLAADRRRRSIEHNDFNDSMFRSLPRIVGFVVGATLLMLFFAFRSYLLPVEAVLMNLLAVAAGIGAVVAVFQHGWFNGLIGLERPFSAIPLEVPMMVFCLSFGPIHGLRALFLLFRIKREYAIDGDNDRATVAGLVSVAPVITGAGLIMAAVFGAFVSAQLPVLKMMGVGLCVAVLVDATVIRTFIVPAVMTLGGRLNWYPGVRRR